MQSESHRILQRTKGRDMNYWSMFCLTGKNCFIDTKSMSCKSKTNKLIYPQTSLSHKTGETTIWQYDWKHLLLIPNGARCCKHPYYQTTGLMLKWMPTTSDLMHFNRTEHTNMLSCLKEKYREKWSKWCRLWWSISTTG